MGFDDLLELDMAALGVTAVFSVVMYFFMFQLPEGVGWGTVPAGMRIIILVVGLPVYYFVAMAMLNK